MLRGGLAIALVTVCLVLTTTAAVGQAPAEQRATITFPPPAEVGFPLVSGDAGSVLGGGVFIFANDTFCTEIDLTRYSEIQVGQASQPDVCHEAGASLTFVDFRGVLRPFHPAFQPGRTIAFAGYQVVPSDQLYPPSVCSLLADRKIEPQGSCTPIAELFLSPMQAPCTASFAATTRGFPSGLEVRFFLRRIDQPDAGQFISAGLAVPPDGALKYEIPRASLADTCDSGAHFELSVRRAAQPDAAPVGAPVEFTVTSVPAPTPAPTGNAGLVDEGRASLAGGALLGVVALALLLLGRSAMLHRPGERSGRTFR